MRSSPSDPAAPEAEGAVVVALAARRFWLRSRRKRPAEALPPSFPAPSDSIGFVRAERRSTALSPLFKVTWVRQSDGAIGFDRAGIRAAGRSRRRGEGPGTAWVRSRGFRPPRARDHFECRIVKEPDPAVPPA